jgi:Bacterial TSP3 repeat
MQARAGVRHAWMRTVALCAAIVTCLLWTPAAALGNETDRDGLRDRADGARSKKKPRKDLDRDGLGNRAEVKRYKTKPRRRDTDRDGLKDGAEVRRFKTKPRRKDTDRDGLKDGAEVKRFKTNPRKKDTDGDGLTDGAEVRRFKTNPRKRDTDGDGVDDGVEVLLGSDPRNPASTPPPAPSRKPPRPCNTVVPSVAAAQSAVAAAAPGTVVCLANGSYGHVNLSASKAGEVMLQAQTPGGATIAGVTMSGSHLSVSRFRITGTIDVRPSSTGMTADHNFVDLNAFSGYGVMACASDGDGPTCNDVSILNNRFIGRSEEDAIRANRYHDGGDADSHGLLIEGNEFAGNQETGGHNDVFQSVWVGDGLTFRRNYLHDFGGQGFFVKDQASAIQGLIVEDNLIVRQNLPCSPVSLCPTWQLSPFQIFGPIANGSIRHNTVWAQGGDGMLRASGWSNVTFSDNVFDKLGRETSVALGGANNTRCTAVLDAAPPGTSPSCAPGFVNPGAGDYRTPGGRGVTWTLAQADFGP